MSGYFIIRPRRLGDLFSTIDSGISAAENTINTAEGYANQAQSTVNAVTGATGPSHGGTVSTPAPTPAATPSGLSSTTKSLLGGGALALAFLWWKRR